jgi:hypothetical protein
MEILYTFRDFPTSFVIMFFVWAIFLGARVVPIFIKQKYSGRLDLIFGIITVLVIILFLFISPKTRHYALVDDYNQIDFSNYKIVDHVDKLVILEEIKKKGD